MIKLEVNDNGLESRLVGLQQGLRDLSPVWQGPVHDIFVTMEKAQFDSTGSYGGEKWMSLSPQYAKWKEKHYPGQPILQRLGYLRESLINEGEGADWHVFRYGPSFAEYGTKIPYAGYHQFGTINMPPRRPIGKWTKAEGKRIVQAVLAFLLSKMRGTQGPRLTR